MLNKGFTILELLIVLAIISILSVLGYSSYQHLLYKSRRLDAQTTLLDYHSRLQHCFIGTHNYEACAVEFHLTTPQPSLERFYQISFQELTTLSYTLQAQAQGVQQQDSDCFIFSLNHQQQPLSYKANGEANACW